MDDQNQKVDNSILQVTALSDLATVLKDKGLSDAEIAEILLKVTTEVEMEVVEELMTTLSDDKKELLKNMVNEDKSGSEIAEALELNSSEMQEIETRKLATVLEKMAPSLNLE